MLRQLLRAAGALSPPIAASARGDDGRHHPARRQAHAGTDHSVHWPTGCRLGIKEGIIADECADEPMSWEE